MKKPYILAALLVLAGLILAACAPAATPVVVKETVVVAGTPQVIERVVTPTPVPPTAVPPTKAAAATDTIVLSMQQEPDTLHPLIGSMMARTIANGFIRVGCLARNEKLEYVALGCETVPTLENGGAKLVGAGADQHLEVTYKIRKDWRWTDGTPVTSPDVLLWWKLQMDPDMETPGRDAEEKIFDIKVTDDKTVTVIYLSENQVKQAIAGTLKGNVAFDKFKDDYKDAYGDYLTGALKGPVVDPLYPVIIDWFPNHVLGKVAAKDQAKSDYAKKPLGDGAYELKEWKSGQELDYVASSKPFPLGDPKIKNIILRIIPDSNAEIAALQKGEVDLATQIGLTVNNSPELDKLVGYKPIYLPSFTWEHLDINLDKDIFKDVRVRQAMLTAIDRKSISDKVYFGKNTVADSYVSNIHWAYADSVTKYPYDKAKAAQLLKDAGWDCKATPCTKKDGDKTMKLEFEYVTTDRADRQSVAQVIQAQLKSVGFGVNLKFLYGRGLFATASAGGPLSARTFDVGEYAWVFGADPDPTGTYTCNGIPKKENSFSGQNYPGYCNKDFDSLAAKESKDLETALSQDKRKPVFKAIQEMFTKDLPALPIYNYANVFVIRTGMTGFKPLPTSQPESWNAWEWTLSK